MTITLTAGQLKLLEAAVAEGRFASVEEAVRVAVDCMMGTAADPGDLDWVKPLLDEARASLARGEGVTLEEFNAYLRGRS